MQFSRVALLAGLAALVSAQNPFTFTTLDTVTAGSPFTITWAPSTGTTDTVTLVLRQGDSKALDTIETIASKIQNTGSFIWTPSTSLVKGTDYAFEIVDDGNTSIVNYSQQFDIDSTNTVSSAKPSSTAAPSSTSSSSVAASTTGSSSSSSSHAATTSGSSSSATTVSTHTSTASRATSSGSSNGTSSTATSSSASVPTVAANGGNEIRIGAAMLAVVGALMAAL